MKNKLFRIIKNYFFCKKYPFWSFKNCYSKKIDYSTTWYASIPFGWRKAFGKQLSEEIKKVGKEYLKNNKGKKWDDIISFSGIKEKYGELRLDASSINQISKVFEKYELMSIGYCISCGKPARYMTKGWIEYYCKDCCLEDYHRWNKDATQQQDEEYLEKCELSKKDIPILHSYHNTLGGKIIKRRINLKKKYNIDFHKLWGLEEK